MASVWGLGWVGFSNSNPQRQIFRFAVWIALVRVRRFFCLCFTLGAQGAWFFRQGLVCELLGRITLVERKFFCPAENNLLTVILLVWWGKYFCALSFCRDAIKLLHLVAIRFFQRVRVPSRSCKILIARQILARNNLS